MQTMEENKVGYKKTKLGWIPEEWDEVTLGDATSLLTNGFVGKAIEHYSEDADSVLYIQGYNVRENSFKFKGIKRVSLKFHLKHQKSCLQEGDLLTIQTGDVGLTTRVTKELQGSNCHALVISRFLAGFDSKFFSFYFNSYKGRSSLKSIETGSTMKHLNVGDMKKWLIPLPPLKEQQKIAQILSTWDKAIDKLEQLIAQKQQRKKGLMQVLLTGAVRLHSPHTGERFTEEWKEVRLEEITTLLKDGSHGTHKEHRNSQYLLLSAKNIKNGKIVIDNNERRISKDDFESIYKNYFLQQGDILLTIVGTIGRVSIFSNLTNVAFQRSVAFFRFEKEIDEFMAHLLRASNFQKELDRRKVVSAQPGIYLGDLSKIKIKIPFIQEQKKIASVLSAADKEIENLQQQLEQVKKQKKGLMQKLLTGEVRVKI